MRLGEAGPEMSPEARLARGGGWRGWLGRKGWAGVVIIACFALMAFFAHEFVPYSPTATFPAWQPPSAVHWLGTDDYGQDIFSQVVYGSRASLVVGGLAGLLSGVIGTAVGLVAGYLRGLWSEVLMRFVDLMLVIPALALMIIIGAFLPSVGQGAQILIIGALSWLWMARSIRSQVMSERERGYVAAARVVGLSDGEIMVREILPNVMPIVIANLVMVITAAILVQASLNFLGIGNPSTVSWGSMLSLAFTDDAILQGAWWWVVPPGLCIALFAYGFVLLGNDVLDRYARKREG